MKKETKNSLYINTLKIARLNNLQNIIGGSIPPPTRTSLDCPTDTFGTGHSTKTSALGGDI